MPKHSKLKMRARGGMARGGVQAASVGGDIGRWLGDWFQGWLGFAEGGEVLSKSEIRDVVSDLSSSEQNKLIKEITDRKSTRLNSSHTDISRMPSSA